MRNPNQKIIRTNTAKIEEKLNKMQTKNERLYFLSNCLYEREKWISDFSRYSKQKLKRLKKQTAKDYEIYLSSFDKGHLIYWHGDDRDFKTAEFFGINDVIKLNKRLDLESILNRVKSEILLFKGMIKREKSSQPQQKNDTIKYTAKQLVKDLSNQPIRKKTEFLNSFDTVNTDKLYSHFKAGLVDSDMLNEKELETYLKAAFENNIPPTNLFNIKNAKSKNEVMKVFYQYYKDVAGKPYGKQKDYAGLLGNYFQGYNTDTVSSNFSKTTY